MRKFSDYMSDDAHTLLTQLNRTTPPKEYRSAMTGLGTELGKHLCEILVPEDNILLICTNEDADFLAKGLIEILQDRHYNNVALACFWNERTRTKSGIEVAPIVRSYVEPIESVNVFIVVKSVISSGCVVQTNISELVYEKNPDRIMVAAPVIYIDAKADLEAEFERDISSKFEYFYFAEDDERDQKGEIIPGIGGMIYELLDIGSRQEKNKYTPDLVNIRRAKLR